MGDRVTKQPVTYEPGARLEYLFQQRPELQPGPFLAYVEQNSRRVGDLEMLREIKAYRAKHGL